MDFDPKSEADFLNNPFFVKWAQNPNPQTNRFWENWCAQNPGKVVLLKRTKRMVQALKQKEDQTMDEQDYHRILDKLVAANNRGQDWDEHPPKKESRRRFLSWGTSIAASILLMGLLSLGYVWWSNQHAVVETEEINWISKSVPRGMKKAFQLPDGSRVVLNAGSEIRYQASFEKERRIELFGQAFFEVKKDPERPFVVKSEKLETTVLGTSFDVKAYQGEEKLHVAVVTGKVKVSTPDGITTDLLPNQATFYDMQSGSMAKSVDFDQELLLGWKEKVLKFKDADYEEVFSRLSNWYDVKFIFPEGMKLEGEYSARFKDQSLANVLLGMEHSTGLKFKIKDKVVYVKKGKN